MSTNNNTQNNGSSDIAEIGNNYVSTTVEAEGTTTNASTTSFIADANIVSVQKAAAFKLDRRLFTSSSDGFSQEIRDFMGKPVINRSGLFSTGDTISTSGFAVTSEPVYTIANNVIYSDKLKGYLGFRATQCFRLVVNANRFQQGRYMVYAVNMAGGGGNNKLVSGWASTLTQRTTLPHVEFDLNCDTEAVIKLPYVSALNFFPLVAVTAASYAGSMYSVGISPYVALSATSGPTTCSYTLWTWFEDVELVGPATPQSGRISTSRRNKSEVERETRDMDRPISSTLMKVSKVAGLFNGVPLLSSYTTNVSWLADLLGNAAAVFGFSKPNQIASTSRISQAIAPYLGTLDTMDNSWPLSLTAKNALSTVTGLGGTDFDELSFKYLFSIPYWVQTSTFTTSNVVGDVLATMIVRPVPFQYTVTTNGVTTYNWGPLGFISNYFGYWRGTLIYKFKFVKTEFHSGRIAICYQPAVQHVAQSTFIPNYNSSNYVHREIIDLREANEITIEIPFLSALPYALSDWTKYGSGTGSWTIYVVDKLVAPATVSSSISIIVEMAAGPDFEFAVPTASNWTPAMQATPQSGLDTPNSVCEITSAKAIGSSSTLNNDGHMNAATCIGEKISSVRSMLKIFTPITRSLTGQTPGSYVNMVPYALPYAYLSTVPEQTTQAPDFLGTIHSMYAFSTGGVRMKVLPVGSSTDNAPLVAYSGYVPSALVKPGMLNSVVTSGTNDFIQSTVGESRNFGCTILERQNNSAVEVQIPQYFKTRMRITGDCAVTSSTVAYNHGDTGLAPPLFVSIRVPYTYGSLSAYRAASDDFGLGGFNSVPPMMSSVISNFYL